ncbi:hypothetical protein QBC32DRAFT_75151 [Pseudoneurospora amorphoporcata]|uniref:HIT-type domain-containing protein n=1 Tax=Pseudoneurospora amorphoporcata TaxID=241081 RepID=A0AAN6SCE1_9PEZI|nr:hypothetical protein QBC32DRAFT_75151 [Pseudoneurospora amorphoporcata]
MSTESQDGGPGMASDESQRLFADELKALIAGAREEASEVTQNDGQETTQETSSEDQPEVISQPQIKQEPEEEEPTYVMKKSNDQQQEAQEAQVVKPTGKQEPASSPSRKRPSPAEEEKPDSPSKPAKKEAKQCGVCQAQPGKYRCPRCPLMYCSVACNKSHKENHPPVSEPTPAQKQPPTQQSQPAKDDDPLAFLLPHAHHITRLLNKYPHLESRLNHILAQTLPPSNNPQGLAVDPNTGFATTASGLPVRVQVPGYASSSGSSYMKKDTQPWSKEVGLRRGAAALKRARTDPTETGDGVRELCDTVLWLLKSQERGELPAPGIQNGGGVRDVTQLVREEVVKEEQEVVKRMLEDEIKREGGDR